MIAVVLPSWFVGGNKREVPSQAWKIQIATMSAVLGELIVRFRSKVAVEQHSGSES